MAARRLARAPMHLVSIHATHQSTPLGDLERLAALPTAELVAALGADPAVDEVAILSTCNRFEVYLVARDPGAAHGAAFTLLSKRLPEGLPEGFRVLHGLESVEHLFRVASGLESLIVGEDQVLGQVKAAYSLAQEAGTSGPLVTLLFERALACGKRARSRTAVSRGAVSVGSAAVDLAERILGTLAARRVLVVGAGEMATLVAKALAGRGARVAVVAHSNLDRARELAATLEGDAVPFAELAARVAESDVVITATGAPEPILSRADLAPTTRPLLLVDIANPRNVARDVEGLPHVRLEDLDGLRRIAEENLARRRAEAEKAAALVREEVAKLAEKFESRAAEEALAKLHAKAKRIQEDELRKALRRLDLTERERKLVSDLVASALKRALGPATDHLRKAAKRGDEAAVRAARQVLGLDAEAPPAKQATVRPRRRRGE